MHACMPGRRTDVLHLTQYNTHECDYLIQSDTPLTDMSKFQNTIRPPPGGRTAPTPDLGRICLKIFFLTPSYELTILITSIHKRKEGGERDITAVKSPRTQMHPENFFLYYLTPDVF